MIRVEVEPYCQQCLDFSPDVTRAERLFYGEGELVLNDTIIRCEHRKRCAGIKRYLDQQMKGEANG